MIQEKEQRDREQRDRERAVSDSSCRDDLNALAAQQAQERQSQDMDISPGGSTPTSEPVVCVPSSHDNMQHQGPVLLANGKFEAL